MAPVASASFATHSLISYRVIDCHPKHPVGFLWMWSAVGELSVLVYLKMSLAAFINIRGYFLRVEKFSLAVTVFSSALSVLFHFL